MPNVDRPDLDPDDALAHVAIRHLLSVYADVITRRAWAELPALFSPDCRIELDTRRGEPRVFDVEAFRAFVAPAVERFAFFEFVILNARIEVEGRDAARGRLYLSELRYDAEAEERSDAYGLYQDRFTRSDGGWRFAHRRYTSLGRGVIPVSSFEAFPLP
jgi:hypothetical protein